MTSCGATGTTASCRTSSSTAFIASSPRRESGTNENFEVDSSLTETNRGRPQHVVGVSKCGRVQQQIRPARKCEPAEVATLDRLYPSKPVVTQPRQAHHGYNIITTIQRL